MTKKPKYIFDGVHSDKNCYIRSWKEKREIVVQVWLGKDTPEGEPEGDFAYPSVLSVAVAIEQAILDTMNTSVK